MLVACLGIALYLLLGPADAKTVQTTHGPVEGFIETLFNGKRVNAYLGVPFAAPPTGKNRFLPPQPLEPWTDPLQAKSQPVSCNQVVTPILKKIFWGLTESTESEDCLYLNVWTPRPAANRKLPVMIYIYGGGYFGGSANVDVYHGGLLAANHDVIVAAMNYRASFFGFLYLNNTVAPGNMALRDQIEAIKWIKANTEAFGGDPEQITVFGESAGSISIALHLTNPETDDLYRYAIMESGTVDMKGITEPAEVMLSRSLELAQKVGCPTDDSVKTVDCLQTRDVSELEKHVDQNLFYLNIPFVPVRNGREVPLDPKRAAQNVPAQRRKSIISGDIRNDFGYFVGNYFPGKMFGEDFSVSKDDWNGLLKTYYELSDEKLASVLTDEYVGSNAGSNLREEAAACIADSYCQCPQLDFTRAWPTGANRVYYYHFTRRPSRPLKAPVPTWLGPTHGDDLTFVFGLPLNPSNNYTEGEKVLSENMMRLWTTFAKTGNPNCPGASGTHWPALQPGGGLHYLELDEKITVKTNLKEKECDFWRNVYPGLVDSQKRLDEKPGKAE